MGRQGRSGDKTVTASPGRCNSNCPPDKLCPSPSQASGGRIDPFPTRPGSVLRWPWKRPRDSVAISRWPPTTEQKHQHGHTLRLLSGAVLSNHVGRYVFRIAKGRVTAATAICAPTATTASIARCVIGARTVAWIRADGFANQGRLDLSVGQGRGWALGKHWRRTRNSQRKREDTQLHRVILLST